MDWLEVTVLTQADRLDRLVSALEELGVGGLVINDETAIREFLDGNRGAWDYVGEEVFDSVRCGSSVQFYLEESTDGRRLLEEYREALTDYEIVTRRLNDEDWLNSWRAFFKPIEVGSRLLIVPAWEKAPADTNRILLRIEPGKVFGTGSHAATRMCLNELESVRAGNVLDLGCGSGILAIGALLFGSPAAVCCDIAEDAEAVCCENARLNGINLRRMKAYTCDILNEDELHRATGGERYDIVFANIIADVILPLARNVKDLLSPDGVFICSGIIDGRQDEVRSALEESGLQVLRARRSEDWHMFASRRIV
jgi:ribosomal protein L11 methyltransferase